MNTNRRKLLKAVVACLVMLVLVVCFEFSGLAETSSPLEGMRIFLAGDSRSSTDYTFYKEILERKTGGVVLVEGASGCIAAYNASDEYFSRVRGEGALLIVRNDTILLEKYYGSFSPLSPSNVFSISLWVLLFCRFRRSGF